MVEAGLLIDNEMEIIEKIDAKYVQVVVHLLQCIFSAWTAHLLIQACYNTPIELNTR